MYIYIYIYIYVFPSAARSTPVQAPEGTRYGRPPLLWLGESQIIIIIIIIIIVIIIVIAIRQYTTI